MGVSDRQRWMGVLARAPGDALAAAFDGMGAAPAFEWLRPPEFGAVMVRGRTGGTGSPFNLGEVSVTRCSLKLADGAIGHAYVAGRDRGKARIAALCDAMLQGKAASRVARDVIAPMEALIAGKARDRSAKAEGTRVEFFTMVRGEG